MASTGEPDRKRRHFSSISPSEAAAAVKKQPFFWPSSEDKLDTAVLQFQNLQLSQKLEAQQVECSILEDKLSQIKEKQLPYSSSLKTVHKSWEKQLTATVESCSVRVSDSSSGAHRFVNKEDGSSPAVKNDFINRLLETGATESSSSNICSNRMEENGVNTSSQMTQTLSNLVAATDDLRCLKDDLYPTVLRTSLGKDLCGQLALSELESEIKSFRGDLDDVLVKFKSLSRELQSHRDADAKVRADLKRIRGELEDEVVELQQCNGDLSALRAERDATAGAFFPVLSLGNKLATSDRERDKQRDLHDMETVLKELTVLASGRLQELKDLHEERTKMLEKMSNLQNKSKSVRCISSSQACLSLKDQLKKSKEAVFQYMALLEKLQVEKDSIVWKEREMNIKNELVDVSRRTSAVADSRMASLDSVIQKQLDEKMRIKTRLGNISRERGRKEIFADMKALISSFPEEMSSMRNQLDNYKETAGGIHSLRADVQSLSGVLCRKTKECEALHLTSADYASQLGDLNATVCDLKNSHEELKLFLDMYKRESTDPRDIAEAKEQEYRAWAHVQSLKSSLDEQNLELRVKAANEAEAVSQQMLAAAEAEIADLRQKMDDCKRDVAKHSDILKSKHEEHGTYLSEIQTIGSAYEDIVPQNQQLLLQVTERDDYNIKLFLEGITSRQMQDTLLIDKYIMDKDIQQGSAYASFLSKKSSRIEDQLRFCTDQFQKLAEDKYQKSVSLENLQKKRADIGNGLEQARSRMEESHSKVEQSRVDYGALELELEIERFNRRRIEEEMEIAKKKVSRLRSLIEGSSAIQKLRQELSEFKEILKCKACNDRPKEVVITKCYHLFCNPCVQKLTGTRQKKCPTCSASFGPNDIKPIYI
ncbi:E3 ubiquitin-protein ligase BRE1-like 1 isoform X1 [Arabidopsis lyrata subsp. lyrata]|uniref:E3 ubiquitin-protein ligase BRE1-like 1 isoform X1 n=2 Tax=Arabidopsis lyrata subsp. lyrata TaxID=81972 RepID=UPI000A29DBAE|nr:E3 ubiquitin-protein ligase BRE1-like 1 isoform X1 [Arabidopsis lyrata subsp. lyrata]|eukprot:XP_020882677.1 E3 ubiquitin-protein ligase BRE1-like 1 isoform X1 [Arabidopsis lyrata subsp. lyrata]